MLDPHSVRAEAEIRAVYRLKDRCYETRDVKRLASTDLPTFCVFDEGRRILHRDVWKSINARMAWQVWCVRRERPMRIVVQGDRARAEVALSDDYGYWSRLHGDLQRRNVRAHGWSDWVRTSVGWKQADLRLDYDAWLDSRGTWRQR